MKIKAYRRSNGKFGIRNHLVILPASVCASQTAEAIARQVEGAVALPHQHGCCQIGEDFTLTYQTLAGLGKNPNVGAVLVISLGCEGIPGEQLAEDIAATGKPTGHLIIQEAGGTLKTIDQGVKIAQGMNREISHLKREEVSISELVLGIECGGSDATSGVAANPAVGVVSDTLVEKGGTTILSETTELIGAEHILAQRAASEDAANKLFAIVKRCEDRAFKMGVDIRQGQPTPGNIQGGITTIEEKSLGCIYKAGSAPVTDVLEYGEEPKTKGLFVMDTPGQDIESITGMLAGGAQIIIFTTGRGTPTGSPIAPVIKVTGNTNTFEKMQDNIDLNAGKIVTGESTISETGKEIFDTLVTVSNGALTKAEQLGYREFALFRIGPTF